MKSSKLQFTAAMVLFGTIGLFVRAIPLPSSVIAGARGLVGMLFLLIVLMVQRKRLSWADIRRNGWVLCLSGAALGGNWVLLFEAYRYTTVATATLCYYMAPLLVILVSPLVLKERLTGRKLGCVLLALVGAVCISGVIQNGMAGGAAYENGRGILFGLGAACLYATVMLLNKKLRDISSYDRTVVQLGVSAAIIIPYVLITEEVTALAWSPSVILLLVLVGILHTGIAYTLYFGSMKGLRAQTVAIFSYLDPVVAILLSALVLREGMDLLSGVGAVLILGSALLSELPERKGAQSK